MPKYRDIQTGEILTQEQFDALPDTSGQISQPEKGKETGFLGRIGGIIGKRREEVGEIADITRIPFVRSTEKRGQAFPEGVLQTVGKAVGGLADIGFETARTITPRFIKEPIKGIGREILETEVGQAGLRAAQQGLQTYQRWKDINPREARNLEAVLNISQIIPQVKGVSVAGKGLVTGIRKVAPTVEKVAEKGTKRVQLGLEKKILDEAIDITKPILSKEERKTAIEAGRGVTKKRLFFLKERDIKPGKEDNAIAESVSDVVKKGNNFEDNIDEVVGKISRESEIVEQGLRRQDAVKPLDIKRPIIPDLLKKLQETKEDSRVLFGSDKTLENSYDTVIEEFIRIYKKIPIKTQVGEVPTYNLLGVLDARKRFDDVMEEKFPRVFDREAGDNIKANAILDTRRGANNFLADALPEGNEFKPQLKELSRMFEARKRIAENAAVEIGKPVTEQIMSALRKNVAVHGLTGGILTIGALTNILTNPVFLGSLVVYGFVRIGTNVITSRMVRTYFLNFLRTIERGAGTIGKEEREAIKEVIKKLPD